MNFLEDCAREPDIDIVIARYLEIVKLFGFDVSAAGAWIGVGAARTNRFYFNNWPKSWFELYQQQGFFADDPMFIETCRRMTPFLWSEMASSRSFTVEGARVVEAGRAYGWAEVMGVPIHGPASYQGLVTLAAYQPVTMSVADRGLLRAAAIAVHDRAHESEGLGEASQPEVQVSEREVQCMRWVAAGKTDAEIGIILGIAAATVHYHVERVKQKFATSSRTKAVAFMVLAGTI